MTAELLTLLALDADDLSVLSAHLQDAVLRPQDISWRKTERQLVLVLRRFDWSAPADQPRRRLTGLHFDRVQRVVHQGIGAGRDVLCALALTFEATDAPSGAILITFAGGGALRVEVECIEAQLRDLGPAWEAASRPSHSIDEA
ncbi:DUF2948 family protein [Chelatococcus reniformis]|uniref:DUF2948 domain-containing protein n=1 Tax=Chelatococcus reniformis TaxID=1494448 RepID=A0A916XLF2_9HYPH|nr:DUF2948 family protein [Chelatococcus reniformis]GGC83665.1 hypothetical protein GCM10010994_46930 [Chelatococcus reniformis]